MKSHAETLPPPEGQEMTDFLRQTRAAMEPTLKPRRKHRPKTHRQVALGVAALLVAGGGAAVASTASSSNRNPDSYSAQSEKWGVPHGVTADGRTYGTSPAGGDDSRIFLTEYPDLIQVIGDHGKTGYVDSKMLFGWEPNKQCESQVLPVYAQDGRTRIDTFTSGDEGARLKGFTVKSSSPCSGDGSPD